ncbi:MAG TPA: hypothetical protein PKD86_07835, partial [Gemmatales bacterium]|nr:hypothetical protein [Gemmatales bacterium]
MPIKTTCPHCAKQFKAKDDLAGRKVSCPGCKKIVGVPEPSSQAHPALKAPKANLSKTEAAELEALAAEVVAEKPPEPEPSQVTIDF